MKIRETQLSGENLIKLFYEFFKTIEDHRGPNITIRLENAIQSAFAMFALKFPSLLQFEKERKEVGISNLANLFLVDQVPSDTQMREIVDGVSPKEIRKLFKNIFKKIQKAKKLEAFEFMRLKSEPHYLLPVDGTGYFSSHSVCCPSCQVKEHRNGDITYYHQMLNAAIVHPSMKTVIPMAPEPILKQDGATKNDCEYNAFKRFADQFRSDHPKLKVIIAGDALYAKGALIKILKQHSMSYILNVKPKGNEKLFNFIQGSEERGHVLHHETQEIIGDKIKKTRTHKFRYKNGAPIDNNSSLELQVNFLEYWEVTEWIDSKGREQRVEKHFSWVTDINLNKETIWKVMRGGRARWTIENEVFNTIKNHGYHFEHNFGHGEKNLSTNFAMLMMLAFYMDQVQEMACKSFQKILKLLQKCRIWEKLRTLYQLVKLTNWTSFLELLIGIQEKTIKLSYQNSS